jgi:hypothetical protein
MKTYNSLKKINEKRKKSRLKGFIKEMNISEVIKF